jgi:hypothetical protein
MVKISGGQNLERALAEIAKKVATASEVNVGFQNGATYPDKDHTLVAMVAAIQEFGAPSRKIPPRPFFRNMIAEKSPGWPKTVGALLVASKYDAAKTLGSIGEVISGELHQSIIDTQEPALSPITVMLRGMRTQSRYQDMKFGELIGEAKSRVDANKTNYGASTKPLVDTGLMLRSITSVVT